VNAGNRCNFIRELPAGPAVFPPINGSVGAVGRRAVQQSDLSRLRRLTPEAGRRLLSQDKPRKGIGGMRRQRDFLLLVTLAATAATPALGQNVSPAIGPASRGMQQAASIPNFSGVWSHPYWPGFEPPASGPGPITNRSRLLVGPQRGVGNPIQLVGDYTNPILKPEAAGVVKKQGENELNGVGSATPLNQCWPGGVPFVLRDIGMQMLQAAGQDHHHLFSRKWPPPHVRMNQPHPAQLTPSWYGDSVGHYEGDTLVIDTVGVKVGPFAMVDMYGTPHTDALHVVERYRLVDYDSAKEALERNAKENLAFTRNNFVQWGPQLSRQAPATPIYGR
jgi:hypothetical protein